MSLLACVIIASISLVIGIWEHSLVVRTNGFITLIDIGNSLLFLAAIERSTRSPDFAFNYGYGKYESLAILVSAVLLTILTIVTIIEAVSLMREPPHDTNTAVLVIWSVIAFLIMRNTSYRLEKNALRFHQPMLHYDAELWRMDSWVEVGVIGGIVIGGFLRVIGSFQGAVVADTITSIALLLFTLNVPIRHGREAFRQLLDRTLPDSMQYEILRIIANKHNRMCEFRSVHTRQSGRDIFIEIDLVMPYDYNLETLYLLERDILKELNDEFPTAIPRVYVTPCDKRCELHGKTTCPVKLSANV